MRNRDKAWMRKQNSIVPLHKTTIGTRTTSMDKWTSRTKAQHKMNLSDIRSITKVDLSNSPKPRRMMVSTVQLRANKVILTKKGTLTWRRCIQVIKVAQKPVTMRTIEIRLVTVTMTR